MSATANCRRDVFAFSLGGAKAVSSFVCMPAIADDAIARAWDRRLCGGDQERPKITWLIVDFLARYFAPGYIEAA